MHTCTVAWALWHAVGSQVERVVRPHGASAEKATVVVFIDYCQGILKVLMYRCWLIQMPFEVGAHPVETPFILSSDKLHTSHRCVPSRLLVLPVRPDLEDIDCMADNRVAEVELFPEVCRRLMTGQKPLQCCVVRGALKFVECHELDGSRTLREGRGGPLREAARRFCYSGPANGVFARAGMSGDVRLCGLTFELT
jgi:hypothetical protein